MKFKFNSGNDSLLFTFWWANIVKWCGETSLGIVLKNQWERWVCTIINLLERFKTMIEKLLDS